VQLSRSAVISAVDLNRSATSIESISTDKEEFGVLSHYVAPLGTFIHRGKRAQHTDNVDNSSPDLTSAPISKKVKREEEVVDLTDSDDDLLPSESARPSAAHTTAHAGANATAPATLPSSANPNTDTWLAPLLRARQVREPHIQLCEQVLVRDEGFTNPISFSTGISTSELEGFLKGLGTISWGLQANVRDTHRACAVGCAEVCAAGGKSGVQSSSSSSSSSDSDSKSGGTV